MRNSILSTLASATVIVVKAEGNRPSGLPSCAEGDRLSGLELCGSGCSAKGPAREL
jgi:hypothetical protein